jgi:hypothetical protein
VPLSRRPRNASAANYKRVVRQVDTPLPQNFSEFSVPNVTTEH